MPHRLTCLSLSLVAAVATASCGDDDPAAFDAAPPDLPDAAPPDPDAPIAGLCGEASLEASLRAIPGVATVEARECGGGVEGTAQCFVIDFDQPIDHEDTDGARFSQRLFLAHRGCDRPTLVADWGYANDYFYDDELSILYQTNTLWIEHRFQGESVPAPTAWDWTALTIENGAADMHRIITALRPFYGGRWVSTGSSKGGATAVYHQYFYPDDVDGSVPYVAPASHARIDPAYQTYLEATLPAPCASAIRAAQVAALTTRRAVLNQRVAAEHGPGHEYLVEMASARLDWGFWQSRGVDSCVNVPAAGVTDEVFWEFFDHYGRPDDFAPAPGGRDERSWSALTYEWLTEHGFALQIGAHVAPLLVAPQATATFESTFRATYPDVPLPPFDGSVTTAVRTWVRDDAKHMVLIYGQYDPWSGGALDAPSQPTSARYFVSAATHAAKISDLPPAERQAALALVSPMFGVDPVPALAQTARRAAWNRQKITDRHLRQQWDLMPRAPESRQH